MEYNKDIFDNITVSYFKEFTGKESFEMPVSRVLRGIKSDCFKATVENVRKYRDSDVQLSKQYKTHLHAVTFSGLFPNNRTQAECTHYNNLLVLDIDHLYADKMFETRECLNSDPYVAAFWLSPSGRGYKGLVHLSYEDELSDIDMITKHKIAFRQLYTYLLSTYGIELDRSGSDISRLCFMSWDPYLVTKDISSAYEVKVDDLTMPATRENGNSPKTTPLKQLDWNHIIGTARYPDNSENRFKLGNIYKKLLKRHLSITDTYENWVKVAFAIASSIHPVKGKELFIKLCELDGVNNDKTRSEHLIYDAYAKNTQKVKFGTIIYLAKQKGLNFNS